MKKIIFILLIALGACGDPDISLLSLTEIEPLVNPNVGVLFEDANLRARLDNQGRIVGYGSSLVFATDNSFESFGVSESLGPTHNSRSHEIAFNGSDVLLRYDAGYNTDAFRIFDLQSGEWSEFPLGNERRQNGIEEVAFLSTSRGIVLSEDNSVNVFSFDLSTNDITDIVDIERYRPLDMDFTSALVGYVLMSTRVGSSAVWSYAMIVTTDGGQSWSDMVIFDNPQNLDRIEAIDGQTAIVYSDDISSDPQITINGGFSWRTISPADFGINDMFFLNSSTGYLLDGEMNIYKTTNGSVSWEHIGIVEWLNESQLNIVRVQRLHFADEQNGIAVGNNNLLRTSDGGKTWELLIHPFAYTLGG